MSYTIRCPFCKREHVSEFFDDIQEEILACRDGAPEWQRGNLASWSGPSRPMTVELREYAESFYPQVSDGP